MLKWVTLLEWIQNLVSFSKWKRQKRKTKDSILYRLVFVFSLLSSFYTAHITRGVKLGKCVTNQGIYPIFMMHNISPSFTSSSIIYGFIYLYYCTHSFTIPLFTSCLSLVCFSLRKVHLPLQVTVFPTLFNTNHISF